MIYDAHAQLLFCLLNLLFGNVLIVMLNLIDYVRENKEKAKYVVL